MTDGRLRAGVVLGLTALAGVLAFGWPLLLGPGATVEPVQAPLLLGLVLSLVLVVMLAEISANAVDARGLAMLGVLTAVGAVLRPLSAGTGGLELVFFLLVLAGRVLGAGFGFALGATTMLASALLTGGVGPWLPYQMVGAGFVGLGAGLLPRRRPSGDPPPADGGRGRPRAELALLAGYGAIAGFGYGWLLDFAFWPFGLGPATQFSWDPWAGPWQNLRTFALYNLATSMGWNLGRAVTNVVLIVVLGPGILRVLRRSVRGVVILKELPMPTRSGNTGRSGAS